MGIFFSEFPATHVAGQHWLIVTRPSKGSDSTADNSFDASRMARDQQSRIAASISIGFNALKPMIRFQVSLLRLWADELEALAQNYEKGVGTFNSALEREWQRQRAA